MVDFREKLLNEKSIYQGKIINVMEETVSLPNGQQAKREIVHHQGAVALLCLTATQPQKIILVEQWRQPMRSLSLEVPAGKIEAGEAPEYTAKRELNEEVRLTAGRIEQLAYFYTSPGFADEQMYLYLMHGLHPVAKKLPQDADEFLKVVELTTQQADQAVASRRICDGKTLLALAYWKLLQVKGS